MFETDKFRVSMNRLAERAGAEDGWRNSSWTKEIKDSLNGLAQPQNNMHACYSGCDGGAGEWLFDVCWLEYSEPNFGRPLKRLLLAAECEWGNQGDIFDDFEKLLVARADVRLMMFDDSKLQSWQSTLKKLCEMAEIFTGSTKDDRFVFACYLCKEKRFEIFEWKIGEPFPVC